MKLKMKIANFLAAESEDSSPSKPKIATGHDTQPVPSNSLPHSLLS
jgi:hypothetical protein